jgi:hypothetical protein
VTHLWTGAERRQDRSWSPRHEPETWPPATFLVAMAALVLLAVALLALDNARCDQWSQQAPTAAERAERASACTDLNR